jgi:hypothetical protein
VATESVVTLLNKKGA